MHWRDNVLEGRCTGEIMHWMHRRDDTGCTGETILESLAVGLDLLSCEPFCSAAGEGPVSQSDASLPCAQRLALVGVLVTFFGSDS